MKYFSIQSQQQSLTKWCKQDNKRQPCPVGGLLKKQRVCLPAKIMWETWIDYKKWWIRDPWSQQWLIKFLNQQQLSIKFLKHFFVITTLIVHLTKFLEAFSMITRTAVVLYMILCLLLISFIAILKGSELAIAQMIALNIVELRKILQNTKQSIQKLQTKESLGCIWWLIFRGQVTSSCLRGIWPRMSFRKNINVKKS